MSSSASESRTVQYRRFGTRFIQVSSLLVLMNDHYDQSVNKAFDHCRKLLVTIQSVNTSMEHVSLEWKCLRW